MSEILNKYSPPEFNGTVPEALKFLFGAKSEIDSEHYLGSNIKRFSLTSKQEICCKITPLQQSDRLFCEAQGLLALKSYWQASLPQVFLLGKDSEKAYLLSSYLTPIENTKKFSALLGEKLAQLHKASLFNKFGWHNDNWIGAFQQKNDWHSDWQVFFTENRLKFQLEQAQKRGYLTEMNNEEILNLLQKSQKTMRELKQASLLHGDLWTGNCFATNGDNPALIDPAIFYGDPETDLAMSELFGGFGSDFYTSYYRIIPKAEGYSNRKIFYDLYHMLNHLNIFGYGYLPNVEDLILQAKAI